MRLNYDTEADALDVSIAAGIVARTEEIASGTLVDLDAHGNLLSIEVLGPGRAWPLEDILDRFPISDEDAELLRSIRGTSVRFTLSEPLAVA